MNHDSDITPISEHQASKKVERPAESARFMLKCRDYEDEVFTSDAYALAIPEATADAISRYAYDHYPVGSFLEAVITNDLRTAICSADPYNMYALPAIIKLIYNTVPATARGDQKKYDNWTRGTPLNGNW